MNSIHAAVNACMYIHSSQLSYRHHRCCSGVASRNFQARMALQSRDDLADLHFAEWRVPCAVRAWRKRIRAFRCESYDSTICFLKGHKFYPNLSSRDQRLRETSGLLVLGVFWC